jgi:hypothetical protein
VGVGASTVTASQAGTANYQAAPSVARSFTVSYPPLYAALAVTIEIRSDHREADSL